MHVAGPHDSAARPLAPRHGRAGPAGGGCRLFAKALGKITADSVFLEELERDPARFLPDLAHQQAAEGGDVVAIDLNQVGSPGRACTPAQASP